jgi:peptidoglycan/xylan/chitin deacetylase (PgdA/CDA1 family)
LLTSRPLILCYHRISDSAFPDINKLSVSPNRFISQLSFLSSRRKFVSLEEMVVAPSANTIAITFDDGYRDNCSIAANILTDFNIPASFFLATRFIESSVNYYPSSFNALWNFYLAQRTIPEVILGSPIEKLLREEVSYFRALHKLSTNRPEALWELSKILNQAQLNIGPIDELEMPMSVSEVASLVSSDLFSIGPHTATHPRMSSIPPEEAVSDFAESIATVAKWGESKTMYFPYPFGQKSDFNAALEAEINSTMNFKGLSTFPIAIGPRNANALTLPRLSVQNWGIDKFRYMVNLANAFSYAPAAAILALKTSANINRLKEF